MISSIRILTIIFCVSIVSCSNLPSELYLNIFSDIKNRINISTFHDLAPRNIDSSYLEVKIGANSAVLVLSSYDEEKYRWVGIDSVIETNTLGRIILTEGLEHNIISTIASNETNILTDFYNPTKYYVRGIISRPLIRGADILEKSNEIIFYNEIDWTAKNYYEYKSNNIFYTKQKIHPALESIEMYFIWKD